MDSPFVFTVVNKQLTLKSNNVVVVQKLNEFVPSVDLQDLYDSRENSEIVTFSSFLENVKNGVDATYMWTNCNGNDLMRFKADTSTFESISNLFCAGSSIKLGLSDSIFKNNVISELSKLL